MSILNYMPTFHVVEMNRSTGLVTGHVLSQYPADVAGANDLTIKAVAGTNGFIENGLIAGLNPDLTIGNYDATVHAQPFIIFTEELNTFMDALKYYALPLDASLVAYPRAVALYVGDVWTTDYFVGTGQGGIYATGDNFAKVVDGKLTLQQAADADTLFAVELSTLPAAGEEAVRVTYIGKPVVTA